VKRCPRCRQAKPPEAFHRDRRRVDGRCVYCAECNRAKAKAWKGGNRERAAESSRRWYEENKDQAHAASRRWVAENPERRREIANASKRRERAEHPERVLMRRRLEMRARRTTGEAVDWAMILSADPCSYCGGAAETLDHIQPVAAAGDNAWPNLTGACRSCNSSKGADSMLMFLLRDAA
jgi:5-methylcytosine-specific restriction endonuclease McrA